MLPLGENYSSQYEHKLFRLVHLTADRIENVWQVNKKENLWSVMI